MRLYALCALEWLGLGHPLLCAGRATAVRVVMVARFVAARAAVPMRRGMLGVVEAMGQVVVGVTPVRLGRRAPRLSCNLGGTRVTG